MEIVRVGMGRRVAALLIDWFACVLIASTFFDTSHGAGSFIPLAVFFAEVWVLTVLQGASAGQRVVGMRVVRYSDGGPATATQVLVRTFLLCLVVTAITFDENGRGLHERISGTILKRV
ncbi:MAG: RDD family protein [Actinobacteria bacterium]|nr:RDD family protein [Actinomycetota bacterium]